MPVGPLAAVRPAPVPPVDERGDGAAFAALLGVALLQPVVTPARPSPPSPPQGEGGSAKAHASAGDGGATPGAALAPGEPGAIPGVAVPATGTGLAGLAASAMPAEAPPGDGASEASPPPAAPPFGNARPPHAGPDVATALRATPATPATPAIPATPATPASPAEPAAAAARAQRATPATPAAPGIGPVTAPARPNAAPRDDGEPAPAPAEIPAAPRTGEAAIVGATAATPGGDDAAAPRDGTGEPRAAAPVPRPRAAAVEHVTVALDDATGTGGSLRVSRRGANVRATLVTDDAALARRLEGRLVELRATLAERGIVDAHVTVRGPAPGEGRPRAESQPHDDHPGRRDARGEDDANPSRRDADRHGADGRSGRNPRGTAHARVSPTALGRKGGAA